MPSPEAAREEAAHIALLSRGLDGGGVQRMMRHLADELLARGFRVDLLVAGGRSSDAETPDGLRVIRLRALPRSVGRVLALRADPGGFHAMLKPVLLAPFAARQLGLIPALARYLRKERPDGLIAATTYMNLAAIWARTLADVPTRVLVSERTHLSESLRSGRSARAWRWRYLPSLLHRTYPMADAVTAVSVGAARDLEHLAALPKGTVRAIYNPVLTGRLERATSEPPDPWLLPKGPPVILTAGRLTAVKDHPTLLRGFGRLHAERHARLLILGEGPERRKLERLARALGVQADVRFVGWVDDVGGYMRHAAVFALTSVREGFGNVLVEALAAGCPVVATDCPSGPREILDGGRYGRLVPVGDDRALAAALAACLDSPGDMEVSRRRAAGFTASAAVDGYLDALGFAPLPSGRRAVAAE
ncbi:MAG: glycosyltransferase [Alphaproteobacteria bacterium]